VSGFGAVDGAIVGLYLLGTMVAGVAVRRYVGRVEHFLLAGREMDVHLGIASLAATEFGIVTCMYTAQNGHLYGFAGATPGLLQAAAMLFVGLTGFGVGPMRDAGVTTLPELLERRFGPRVRWAAGVVIVLGGLLNMGVFLRTGGEFLLLVTGAGGAAGDGGWVAAHLLEITMTVLLLLVAIYTVMGGMLSVLVTDFLQFVVMSAGLLVVTALILYRVGWGSLVDAVATHRGAGGFNPFANPEMGWAYVLFNACLQLAAVLTWQTAVQRVLAARDTRTGLRIYTGTSFFFVARFVIPGLWGIAALAALGPQADSLHAMPRYLATIVPAGLMGLLIAAMLAADMSTDSSYMLTWGGVIWNDILRPLHRGLWGERRGLRWNRSIVAGIGVFLLFYGLWYPLRGDLWTYCGVTGTIYLASMSVLLVACCYWKGANATGASAAIVTGAVIPVAYLVLEQLPSTGAFAREAIGPYWSGLAAYAGSALAMVAGSKLGALRARGGGA